MSIAQSLRVALDSLTANALRTALTMLGLVIGVSAVIALLAVGRGSQEDITNRISSLGTNLLTIRPGSSQQGGVRTAAGSRPTLTYEDAQAIAAPGAVPGAAAVTVEQQLPVQILAQGTNVATSAIGTDDGYPLVRNSPVASGEFFSAEQVRTKAQVVVLGSNVAKNLFGDVDPVGQSVRISLGRTGINFNVIGVMPSKGGTALGNLDDRVLVPITTAVSKLARFRTPQGQTFVGTINVEVATRDAMQGTAAQIGDLLRTRHRVTEDDFIIQSQEDTLATANQVAKTQALLLGAIASISLVVGGIGIMNIMLVSVTERTREIGIRKAVGARQQDILLQCLTEAVLVCCVGGLLGVGGGLGASILVDGRAILGETMHAHVTADAVALSLIVSVAIGVFFGLYPASRAARLRPIEALRFE